MLYFKLYHKYYVDVMRVVHTRVVHTRVALKYMWDYFVHLTFKYEMCVSVCTGIETYTYDYQNVLHSYALMCNPAFRRCIDKSMNNLMCTRWQGA